MDATGVTGYDYAAFYYDERGRIIQSRATNHMGGIEEEYVAYSFTGEPLKRQHEVLFSQRQKVVLTLAIRN